MARDASSSTGTKIRLAGCFVLPVVLYAIPLQWVMHGPTLCLFHRLFGHACYGCGMTQALFSLLHFDFAAAWEFNRLVVVVAPLLAYLYIKEVVRAWRSLRS